MSGRRAVLAAPNLAAMERRRNLALEARAKGRAEEGALEASLAQTEQLALARGETLERPERRVGEPRRPMRRITGLQWLLARGRIDPVQSQAGERYGALCWQAGKGDLPSSLKERIGGPLRGGPGDARMAALVAKDRADWAIRGGLPDAVGRELVALCGKVCGETATVREAAGGDRQAAERMEVQLAVCLNMLAVHFGIVQPARR